MLGPGCFLAPTPTFFLWKAGGWRTRSQRSSSRVTKRGFPGKIATTASASWDGFPLNLFAWEAQLREIQLAEVPWVASDRPPPLGQRGPGGALPASSRGEFHGSLERGEKAPSLPLRTGGMGSRGEQRRRGDSVPGTPAQHPADTCHASPDEGTPSPGQALGNALQRSHPWGHLPAQGLAPAWSGHPPSGPAAELPMEKPHGPG